MLQAIPYKKRKGKKVGVPISPDHSPVWQPPRVCPLATTQASLRSLHPRCFSGKTHRRPFQHPCVLDKRAYSRCRSVLAKRQDKLSMYLCCITETEPGPKLWARWMTGTTGQPGMATWAYWRRPHGRSSTRRMKTEWHRRYGLLTTATLRRSGSL